MVLGDDPNATLLDDLEQPSGIDRFMGPDYAGWNAAEEHRADHGSRNRGGRDQGIACPNRDPAARDAVAGFDEGLGDQPELRAARPAQPVREATRIHLAVAELTEAMGGLQFLEV